MTEKEKNTKETQTGEQEYGLFDMLYVGLKDLVKLMQDIRFAGVILIIIAIATLIGTALPQIPMAGESAREQIIHRVGQNTYDRIIEPAGFDRVFTTNWFKFLLLLTVASVTLCAWGRSKAVLAISRRKNPATSAKGVENLKFHGKKQFDSEEEANLWIDKKLKDNRFTVYKAQREDEIHRLGRKNLTSKWMLVAMHYSFLIMLIGAIIGSAFGKEEYTRVLEGNTWETSDGRSRIRLVEYWMEYDKEHFPTIESLLEARHPTSYKSHLKALDKENNVIREKVIRVNVPLHHHGYYFFQSSWNFQPIISVYHDGERIAESLVTPDRLHQIPDTNIYLYFPFRGIIKGKYSIRQPDGTYELEDIPPMCVVFEWDDKHQVEIYRGILTTEEPIKIREFGETYEIHLDEVLAFSVFQVKRDPGVGIVFIGFIICMIGGTWGLLIPYGISRSLIRKVGRKWEVLWGTTLRSVADEINKDSSE